MTQAKQYVGALACFSALLITAGCGGGGGASSTAAPPAAAAPSVASTALEGPGSFVGTVTGFGSVFVNGVEFFTNGAQVEIDGSPGIESQLKIGQIVEVKGRLDASGRTGQATTIRFNDLVEGPVSALNTTAGTFVVLGQTVRVTDATMFDDSLTPASISGLSVAGLLVQVSGFRNAAGEIVATRIERKLAGSEFEIVGVVSALNTTTTRFSLQGQVIDYSAATVTNGTLANGAAVEVKGTTLLSDGALRARVVELQSTSRPANNDVGRVEGLVTRFVSATDFDVNGTRVTTNSSTVTVTNGLVLAANVKVEVQGRFNADGVLVATRVELRPSNGARLTAPIDSIDATANTLQVLGVTVSFNASTQVEDKSRTRVSPLRASTLRAGDYVELRGFENSAGNGIVAIILEREDSDSRIELRGRVRSATDPNVSVFGRNFELPTTIQLRDAAGATLTRAQFFTQAVGKSVNLRGRPNGTVVIWERAEIEN